MSKPSPRSTLTIGGRRYGGDGHTYIVAEVGSNFDGKLSLARDYIRACAEAGANGVKFQSWQSCKLHNPMEQTETGELRPSPVIPILNRYQLPAEWHGELKAYADSLGVDFLSTPFDLERARLLRELGVPLIKIASGDLTFDRLLKELGSYGLPLLLSTGMADLDEIAHALDCLGAEGRDDVVLLHCVAAYPPDIADANLLALRTLAERFGLPVGLSDHYPGHDTVLAAVALGAVVVEKHVTFSRDAATPDAPFALEIDELAALVAAVRRLEQALGDGDKRCRDSERGGLVGGRRSLFAARALQAGQAMSEDDVAVVRPNIAELKPQDLDRLLGMRPKQDIPLGAPLSWQLFEDA